MSGAMNRRRVAVIGGTGFIGSHLTERLVANGADVLAVAHSRRHIGNLAAVAGAYRFALCDILDHAGIAAALREFRPEIVYHLAAENDAQETFSHMAGAISNNAVGTANVLP